jgi:hypothetical protein
LFRVCEVCEEVDLLVAFSMHRLQMEQQLATRRECDELSTLGMMTQEVSVFVVFNERLRVTQPNDTIL